MPIPGTPIICTVCGKDQFCAGRRLTHVTYDGGIEDKSWKDGLENANAIVCANCKTEYIWNTTTHVYDQQPPFLPTAKP